MIDVIVAIVAGAGIAWLAQAAAVAAIMNRRGFHPLPWFAVAALIGPACWPLAVIEALSGPPRSEIVQRGMPGDGALDALVLLDRDALPDQTGAQVGRLHHLAHRLVIARVVKAGGPVDIENDARRFLYGVAQHLDVRNPELRLFFGDMNRAVDEATREGRFDVVLRADQPNGLFKVDGEREGVRCLRDVPAA